MILKHFFQVSYNVYFLEIIFYTLRFYYVLTNNKHFKKYLESQVHMIVSLYSLEFCHIWP